MGKNITYKGVTKNLEYYKGLPWDKPLTPEMKEFEKETGKNAIFRGVITGTFEYWKYWDKKRTKDKPAKSNLTPRWTKQTKVDSTSIQGGFNELTTPPKWVTHLPKDKRKFDSKLERKTGKYYYYRTYPEDKKQNAANLKNKLELDNFKSMIKPDILGDKKVYRVYKTKRKFIKSQGMKMKDTTPVKRKRSPKKLKTGSGYSTEIKRTSEIKQTNNRYLELMALHKNTLTSKYRNIKGIKHKDTKNMNKQDLSLNILQREVGSLKYRQWYKEYMAEEREIKQTHKRYLELQEIHRNTLESKYKNISGIKDKNTTNLTKQTLILNILYDEVGSIKYGRWYKEYISTEKPKRTLTKEQIKKLEKQHKEQVKYQKSKVR